LDPRFIAEVHQGGFISLSLLLNCGVVQYM
jgi:hypothetical protein